MAYDTKKRKSVQMTSPELVFQFPKLSEPDYGTKEYPKEHGEYSLNGVMEADSAATQAFIRKLQPHFDEAIAEAERQFKDLKVETRKKLKEVSVNDFYTTLYDSETEEPTGEIKFKFAMAAGGVYKKGPQAGKSWSAKPGIFDSQGEIIAKCPAIWGGTKGLVSFQINPYFIPGTAAAGIKLKLLGVQITDLKTAGQRSASSMGFGKVEGGFTASDLPTEDETESETDGDFGETSEGSGTVGEIDF